MPVFKQEDVWCSSSHGVTALCDLSTEQKDSNLELVQHHYTLVVILYAILVFSLKSVKPLSLFDTKVSMCVKVSEYSKVSKCTKISGCTKVSECTKNPRSLCESRAVSISMSLCSNSSVRCTIVSSTLQHVLRSPCDKQLRMSRLYYEFYFSG